MQPHATGAGLVDGTTDHRYESGGAPLSRLRPPSAMAEMMALENSTPDADKRSNGHEPLRSNSTPSWAARLARYRKPSSWRAGWELGISLLPFVLATAAAIWCVDAGYYWGMLFVVPSGIFLVRLFMVQHDCGHGSFFPAQAWNDWVGRALGVLTMTPYAYWRRAHSIHHATAGNLDKRGMGDIWTLTVAEYQALPWRQRVAYRVTRNPFVLLVIGPIWVFALSQRVPMLFWRNPSMWLSTQATNLAIVACATLLALVTGVLPVLLVYLPIVVVAGAIGIWLFYVQHQFEESYWASDASWDFHDGALRGSSHYDLPAPLRWLTLNIGMHHIHHLASRIPCYRLPEVLRDHPELRDIGRLTFGASFRCLRLALWDEGKRRMITFRQAFA